MEGAAATGTPHVLPVALVASTTRGRVLVASAYAMAGMPCRRTSDGNSPTSLAVVTCACTTRGGRGATLQHGAARRRGQWGGGAGGASQHVVQVQSHQCATGRLSARGTGAAAPRVLTRVRCASRQRAWRYVMQGSPRERGMGCGVIMARERFSGCGPHHACAPGLRADTAAALGVRATGAAGMGEGKPLL